MPKCDRCDREASRSVPLGNLTVWLCHIHGRTKAEADYLTRRGY